MYNSSYRQVTHMILESEMLQLRKSFMRRYIRSGMFIYMSALLFNLSFNLIGRIGFFFRSSVKNDFLHCQERAWNFLSIIMYFKRWNFWHWWSKQDDPSCIHCMSRLINEKSIAIWENFRSQNPMVYDSVLRSWRVNNIDISFILLSHVSNYFHLYL